MCCNDLMLLLLCYRQPVTELIVPGLPVDALSNAASATALKRYGYIYADGLCWRVTDKGREKVESCLL